MYSFFYKRDRERERERESSDLVRQLSFFNSPSTFDDKIDQKFCFSNCSLSEGLRLQGQRHRHQQPLWDRQLQKVLRWDRVETLAIYEHVCLSRGHRNGHLHMGNAIAWHLRFFYLEGSYQKMKCPAPRNDNCQTDCQKQVSNMADRIEFWTFAAFIACSTSS